MTGFWGVGKSANSGVEFELEVEIQKKVFDVDKGMPCTSHPNLYDDMKKQWRFEKRDSDKWRVELKFRTLHFLSQFSLDRQNKCADFITLFSRDKSAETS